MRFSKRKYPLLCDPSFQFIEDPQISNTIKYSELRRTCKQILSLAGVKYCSKTFISHANKNYDRLVEYVEGMAGNEFAICMDDYMIIGVHSQAYAIFTGLDVVAFAYVESYSGEEEHLAVSPSIALLEAEGDNEININDFITYTLAVVKSCCVFEKYAETKVKTLAPGERLKEINCKYTSDIIYPVQLLTENWYTQSCQNHPFIVRGHWRMQPHGKGRKERRLKWIDAFTKQGYTKGAYKDK